MLVSIATGEMTKEGKLCTCHPLSTHHVGNHQKLLLHIARPPHRCQPLEAASPPLLLPGQAGSGHHVLTAPATSWEGTHRSSRDTTDK